MTGNENKQRQTFSYQVELFILLLHIPDEFVNYTLSTEFDLFDIKHKAKF
jgi:hypothetical protein